MGEDRLHELREAYSKVFHLLDTIRYGQAASAWYEATDKQEFVDGEHRRLNGIEKFVYKHRADINTLLAHWEAQQKGQP